MSAATGSDLAAEPYVLLTTFRSSGAPVSTPVWVAEGLDGLLVTTSGESGKVKRIRKNPAVQLLPCDVRGNVSPGATAVDGTATVLDDAESRAAIDAALERKYGVRYKAIRAAGKLRRSVASTSVVLRIVPTAEPSGN
ncbi:PPOX class F420-dependent oxidoreductase [Mycetocola zhujimingii]|uniref:PPOX class F420-dependent oxidoreductase n=1 Tax=Mycetocola zhujimingii TaxID=2079792 RepID=A0A2U1TGW6_9MICO|nr:PPOX class F420-dependent oxidoreductase [Mycetocola zhujimingii]PWC08033.1 PPOX class F420-dependent oxidoreductase [Mycetocola zhujimingii]